MTIDIYPNTWVEAVPAAATEGAVVVAGGTGLQPWLTATGTQPPALVHLGGVTEAWEVDRSARQTHLGAMVPVDHPAFAACFGTEGAGWFATPAVRRRATVVGNVVSALGPRELGPPLLTLGGRLDGLDAAGEAWSRPLSEVLREGLPAGQLATGLAVHTPERVVYHRMSPRRRLSRIELGVCGALGEGCGASVGLGTAAVPVGTGGASLADVGADDFVDAARIAATSLTDDPGRIVTVTTLAARVHRDLNRRTDR